MALAYGIYNVEDLAEAFAAKDEFISALSYRLSNTENYIMDPTDDYYVAPYCFMSTLNVPRYEKAGFLIFSSMVPFIKKSEHDAASYDVKRHGHHSPPIIGTIEEFQQNLKLKERDIYTFTTDGCVPSAQDVSQELEDMTIRVVCDLMRWRFPKDWRRRREEVAYTFGKVLDLANWNRQEKKQQQQVQQQVRKQVRQQQVQQHFYDAKEYDTDDTKNVEDEKKETDYLPLPPPPLGPVSTPERPGGFLKEESFFERNADIFGNDYFSKYNNNGNLEDEQDDDGNTFISNYNMVNDEDDLYDEDIHGI